MERKEPWRTDWQCKFIMIEAIDDYDILSLLSDGMKRDISEIKIESTWTRNRLFRKPIVCMVVSGIQTDLMNIYYAWMANRKINDGKSYPKVYPHRYAFKYDVSSWMSTIRNLTRERHHIIVDD